MPTSWVRVATTDDAAFAATSFTFEAWLNAPSMSNMNGEQGANACCGNYMVRGHWTSTDASNPGVSATFAQHNGGAINSTINGGGGGQPVVSVPYPSPAPGWHHIVHTFTDNGDSTTTIEAFVDGSSAGSTTVNTAMANNNLARDDSDFGLTFGVLPFGAFTGDGFDNPIQGFAGGYDEFAYYDYALSPAQIATHFDAAKGVQRELGEWQVDESGNWKDASNWFLHETPDTNTEVAIFGGAISTPRSVFLESDVTVKGVEFDNADTYAIGGNGGVILDSADTSSIEVGEGSHKFQGPVQLAAPTTATVAADSAVAFDGPLNLTSLLTKEGTGALNVNSLANSGGGSGIVVNAGTLGGRGEIDGSVTVNGGVLSPGISSGMAPGHGTDLTAKRARAVDGCAAGLRVAGMPGVFSQTSRMVSGEWNVILGCSWFKLEIVCLCEFFNKKIGLLVRQFFRVSREGGRTMTRKICVVVACALVVGLVSSVHAQLPAPDVHWTFDEGTGLDCQQYGYSARNDRHRSGCHLDDRVERVWQRSGIQRTQG